MADLVLHESVLALGTEGYFFGDNKLDVRYPHWPGYQSGVSIGVGFDIGASRISAQELQEVMTILGVPDPMIKVLQKGINITGKAAAHVLKAENMRAKVRLTQQQALDIMLVIKQKIATTVGKSFAQSYAIMHPAIIECLKKIAYGAPALVLGWRGQNWLGLGPMYDKRMSKITDHIKQCDLFIEMMSAMQSHAWVSESVKDIHGTRVSRGLKSFIQNIKKELQSGNKVVIETGPVTIEKLLDPKNKTLDFSAKVSEDTHKGGTTPAYLRGQLSKARQAEPAAMQALCSKIGCAVPKLVGSNLDGDNMSKCFEIMTGKDLDIIKAQQQLVILGYYDKAGISGGMRNADGAWGKNSSKTLKLFQKDNNLSETGELDANTKKLLLKQDSSSSQDNSNSDNGNSDNGNSDNNDNNNDSNDSGNNSNSINTDVLKAALKGSGQINGSVGQDGQNQKADVLIVRALLSARGYHDKSVWADIKANLKTLSKIDNNLISAISKFQREKAGLSSPDGRVDPGGTTLRVLNGGQGQTSPSEDETPPNDEVSTNLSGSVGVGGVNLEADVRLIQKLLNKQNNANLVVDGDCGPKTEAAIRGFQQTKAGLSNPDGRVDVGGTTWKALSTGNFSSSDGDGTGEEEELVVQPTPIDATVFPCFN